MFTNQLYPLNWCDFIDVPHILVGVHSLVYDALGSFDSLKVSSVSCLIYLVFSVVVSVHLSLCGYPVSLA